MAHDPALIRADLRTFLADEVLAPGVEVTDDVELAELGVDSFSLMELVLFVERSYGIALPMAALTPENTRTVRALGAAVLQVSPGS